MPTLLRELSNTSDDKREERMNEIVRPAISAMADGLTSYGYEAATDWVSSAGLSPEEAGMIASGLSYPRIRAENGRWIEWMGEHLPANRDGGSILRTTFSNWMQHDYRSVGDWLVEADDSAVRRMAISRFAAHISSHDPEAAARWAETLPGDRNRNQLLRRIFLEWKKTDEPAAAAFAREHGIE